MKRQPGIKAPSVSNLNTVLRSARRNCIKAHGNLYLHSREPLFPHRGEVFPLERSRSLIVLANRVFLSLRVVISASRPRGGGKFPSGHRATRPCRGVDPSSFDRFIDRAAYSVASAVCACVREVREVREVRRSAIAFVPGDQSGSSGEVFATSSPVYRNAQYGRRFFMKKVERHLSRRVRGGAVSSPNHAYYAAELFCPRITRIWDSAVSGHRASPVAIYAGLHVGPT